MPGEGIGPEMMGHLKHVYKEAAVPVDFEMIEFLMTLKLTKFKSVHLQYK